MLNNTQPSPIQIQTSKIQDSYPIRELTHKVK